MLRSYLGRVFASRVFKLIPENLTRFLKVFRLDLVVFLFGLQLADGVFEGLLRLSNLVVLFFTLLHLLVEQFLRVLDFSAQFCRRRGDQRLQVAAKQVAVFPRAAQNAEIFYYTLSKYGKLKILPYFIFRARCFSQLS